MQIGDIVYRVSHDGRFFAYKVISKQDDKFTFVIKNMLKPSNKKYELKEDPFEAETCVKTRRLKDALKEIRNAGTMFPTELSM